MTESISVIQLKDNNYKQWLQSVEVVAKYKKVWNVLNGLEPCPEPLNEEDEHTPNEIRAHNKATEEWQTKDALAQCLIVNSTNEGMAEIFSNCETAAEKFKAIRNKKEGFATSNTYVAESRYYNLKFTNSTTVESYFLELEDIIKQLKFFNALPTHSSIVNKILHDLPSGYESYIDEVHLALHRGNEVKLEEMKQ